MFQESTLNSLIGVEFEIQGVQLSRNTTLRAVLLDEPGIRARRPKKWLAGNGGLRAQILTDGFIEVGDARLVRHDQALSLTNE